VQFALIVAALEDKIVQQAVVTILNQIYDVDFKGFSYGFRPGRSPHQALEAVDVPSKGARRPHDEGELCSLLPLDPRRTQP
jgi:retron-type reverse transcriptase